MNNQNTAPNSWEDASQPAAPPTSSFSGLSLNANAASFVPNANAPPFVPSWIAQPPATPAAVPVPVKAPTPAPAPAPKPSPKVEPAVPKAEKESKKEKPESKMKREASKDSIAVLEEEVQNALDPELFGEFYKEHLNVVFIGHVDAGKSTMGGNILFLTGMVDKRTMEKYEKEAKEAGRESWYLSWALDVDVKERNKGKTVECGKASFETEKRRYTILDAPGHKNFVPSMITGASQADVAVLVISARKGEFETGFERGGQTREHAVLVKTAGVTKLIVAINKMDDPTVKWSKERYDDIVSKLSPFLKGTGYNPKTDVEFIPVSGYSGANIKDAVSKDVCPWFDGIPLLAYLDEKVPITRNFNSPLMMPIADKYKEMGTIVTGKIESGVIKKNMSVLMMPIKKHCEIAAVFNEADEEIPGGSCGDNIRIRLRGIEEEEILSGFVLCDTVKPVCTVTAFEAQVVILESKNIICAGYQAVLHIHNATEEVTFGELLHLIDKKTGRKSKRPPQFAKKGQKIIARLETQQPICVETFANYPQLGRFTLRDEALTIAIGKITKLLE